MKCIQYWPENQETRQFATVDVSHEETLEFEDHVERVFWITHKRVRNQYPRGVNENCLFDRKILRMDCQKWIDLTFNCSILDQQLNKFFSHKCCLLLFYLVN